MTGFGIYHYGARFYSPKLGIFLSADTIVPNAANPQAFNRYSYVYGNPLRYTDPSGNIPIDCWNDPSYCSNTTTLYTYSPPSTSTSTTGSRAGRTRDRDGDVILLPPAVPPVEPADGLIPVTIPVGLATGGGASGTSAACGQEGVYSPECPGWHEYQVSNVVCPAIFNCTEEEMIEYMSRFAYPNQDPSQPAQPYRIYTVGIPIVGLDLDQIGSIRFTTSNGGLTTRNTTLSTHILYDGVVIRTADQNERGDWVITTQGYGNNVVPGMDVANDVGGPILFNTVDTQMFLYIAIDQLFEP
jgi:RHS repeat-associated protein